LPNSIISSFTATGWGAFSKHPAAPEGEAEGDTEGTGTDGEADGDKDTLGEVDGDVEAVDGETEGDTETEAQLGTVEPQSSSNVPGWVNFPISPPAALFQK